MRKITARPKKLRAGSQSFYKLILFFSDFAMVAIGLIMGLGITGMDLLSILYTPCPIVILTVSLAAISFFPTYHLYNYHVIFLFKNHLKNTGKAYCWGILTVGIIMLVFEWSDIVDTNIKLLFVSTSIAAIALLLLSRYFWEHQLHLIKALGIGFIAIGIISIFRPTGKPAVLENFESIYLGLIFAAGLLAVSRFFLLHVVFNIWGRRQFRRQIIILGSDKEAARITNHIIDLNAPFWVTGNIDIKEGRKLNARLPKDYLGNLRELPQIVEKGNVNEIVITNKNIPKHTLIALFDFCVDSGINAWLSPGLLKIIDSKLYIDNFCGLEMIRFSGQKNSWVINKLKHGFDALITLPAFIIQLPVLLFIALAIKLNSKGPVFYLAKAVGKNARIFNMYKFRSMEVDNQSDLHKNYVTKLIKGEITNAGNNGQTLKITNDPRVTAVGRILRKFSLDEMPQLINVLKGDMSLVGPRPCLPYEYDIYKEWHKRRTAVRPGITGLWQVTGRSEVSFEDMILLDLYYMYNRTLLMDLNILFETVFVVLGKKGAY